MALRKAASYSKWPTRAFTRVSRNKSKAYIKVSPANKLAKMTMGNQQDFNAGKHPYVVKFVCDENVQIRDNALEAGRMYVHKILDEQIPGQYYFSVKVYPHHFLRENKVATGAGADRMKCGMTQSFGIVVGRAAIVRRGQDVYVITCGSDKAARAVRDTLGKVKAKIPARMKILMEQKQ